jgi:hypothetical protein
VGEQEGRRWNLRHRVRWSLPTAAESQEDSNLICCERPVRSGHGAVNIGERALCIEERQVIDFSSHVEAVGLLLCLARTCLRGTEIVIPLEILGVGRERTFRVAQ